MNQRRDPLSADAAVPPLTPAGRRRAILTTSVGNMLEWYDFAVYAQFAAYIALNFFPGDDSNAQLLKAFLAFGVGFLVRPLGALLLGNYGDRAGRKATLTLTILLMAAGTALIAFAPTFAAIGIAAPILLLVGRTLQGFSAGGEIGGATAFLLESAEPARRGRIAAWLQASMGMSNMLGALVAFTVTSLLTVSQMRAWGWRIPFLIGLLIVPAGWLLRRSLDETGAFRAEERRRRGGGEAAAPLREVFQHHGADLVVGFSVSVLWAVAVYVLLIFLPTYVQRPDTFNFTATQAFGASLLANIPFVIGCVVCGALSDRIGRRRMLMIGAALLLVCVLPLFMVLHAHPTTTVLVLVQTTLCLLVASFSGPAPAGIAETFPIRVRATGTALVYNLAFTIFGGFAPAILTWLTQRPGGSLFAPAFYVMSAAVVALAAIPFLGRRTRHAVPRGAAAP